jgi:hypothetical protein
MSNPRLAFTVKAVHSLVYLFMSGVVIYILYCGIVGRFHWTLWAALILVGLETLALAINRGQCPLKTLALYYGDRTGDDLIADWLIPSWAVPYTVPFWAIIFITGLGLVGFRLTIGPG